MKTLWNREPVAILAVLQTILALVITFGIELSAEQVGAITAAAAAVLGLVARSQVSPTPPVPPPAE
jgi:hypothetical protein